VPCHPRPIVTPIGELLLLSFTLTAFGVMIGGKDQAGPGLHGAHPDAGDAAVLPSGALYPPSGLPAWRSVLTRIDPPTYIAGPWRHVVVRRLGISAASGRRLAPGVTRAGRLVPQWLSARIAAIMAIAEFRTTE